MLTERADSPLPPSLSVEQLALGYLRLLADGGVSQDPETWVFLTAAQLREMFGDYGYHSFVLMRSSVWPEMQRIAPLIEEWP